MLSMVRELEKTADEKMTKSLEALKNNLAKIRTGRVHVGFLDQIEVEYYGNILPLKQVANITLLDSRTLVVKPHEKNLLSVLEKAIRDSDLGLNPASFGEAIRVPMPMLTEETRKDMIKIVKAEGEEVKISIRNIRRDTNHEIKNLLKDKEISEDEAHRSEEAIQKITDKYIDEIDVMVAKKEKDLLEI